VPELDPNDDRVRAISTMIYQTINEYYNNPNRATDNQQLEIEAKLGEAV